MQKSYFLPLACFAGSETFFFSFVSELFPAPTSYVALALVLSFLF
jgi:hypothetical protein